jgi:hypothetical protein
MLEAAEKNASRKECGLIAGLLPGRISLVAFLHLRTNEPPEDLAFSLTAILADAIKSRAGENGRSLSGNKPRQACLVVAWHIRDETYSKTLAEFVLHIESALQRTGELPSLLMGTVIVLAGAESAAHINARYGSDPSVTF